MQDESPTRMTSTALLDHYKHNFDAEKYLETYTLTEETSKKYGAAVEDFARMYHEVFEAHTPGERLLDVGSGPTVWHVLSGSRRYRRVTLSDPLEQNRRALWEYLKALGDECGEGGDRWGMRWMQHFDLTMRLESGGDDDGIDGGGDGGCGGRIRSGETGGGRGGGGGKESEGMGGGGEGEGEGMGGRGEGEGGGGGEKVHVRGCRGGDGGKACGRDECDGGNASVSGKGARDDVNDPAETEDVRKAKEEPWRKIASRLQSRIYDIIYCNILDDYPLGEDKKHDLYDCVMSSMCLEAASTDLPTYRKAVANLVSLAKPGAPVVIGGVLNQSFYEFGGQSFPCLPVTVDNVSEALQSAGCTITKFLTSGIKDAHADNDGMFVVEARKLE